MKAGLSKRIPVNFESPENKTSNWQVQVVKVRPSDRLSLFLDYFQSAPRSRMHIRLWRKQAGLSTNNVR
jgi:hypothetical protein